jgi:hypothetical protein
MDATWNSLPKDVLSTAFVNCADKFNSQEAANSIYGFAVVDVAWDDLSVEVHEAIEHTVLRAVTKFTIQEMSNLMYSLALLTFDADSSAFASAVDEQINGSLPHTQSENILLNVHSALLKLFVELDQATYYKENFDQFGVYFAFMRAWPGGEKLVLSLLGEIPSTTGPTATIPSWLHTRTIESTMSWLNGRFSVQHEFNGLNGVFPVDAGIFFNDKLLVFIEVDGEFHYKGIQQLRRKDRLKEFLYRHAFPNIPLYRIRHDQCELLGYDKVGKSLALWISAVANKLSAA